MLLHKYHTLNNIDTHLITWGDPFNCNGVDVIIVITGNPGIPDFYEHFGSMLHESTKFPVCIIGHSGHDLVLEQQKCGIVKEELKLQGQIKHKLDLINNLIDSKSKLHLISHSVGSWILLEMFQQSPDLMERVNTVHLLFPVVQNLSKTRGGFFFDKIVRYLHSIVLLFLTILMYFPSVYIFFINIFLKLKSAPLFLTKALAKLLNPKVFENVLLLTYDELDLIVDLNVEALNLIKHFTYVIYAEYDVYAPLCYMDDFKQFLPDIKLKKMNVDHAFVLKSSEHIGEIVSNNLVKSGFTL